MPPMMPPRLNCALARNIGRLILPQSSGTESAAAAAAGSIRMSAFCVSPRHYASAASPVPLDALRLPDDYVPPTKPPAARRPELRKSQLLRTYTALLRSSPIILFLQHNNLTAVEWAAVRRELGSALAEVPVSATTSDLSNAIAVQVLRTRIFDEACKVVEFYDSEAAAKKSNAYTHDLSKTAYETIKVADLHDPSSTYAQISPLLTGPIAAVLFPVVSPACLAAVLKVLAPSPPAFPAPSRRKSPGYYDLTTQSALQKLILVGGRIEGKAFDIEGVKWVGGIDGGLDGLRGQLVAMLQSAGLGLTTTLGGHAKSLWMALEGRRRQLNDEHTVGQGEGSAT